MEKHITLSHQSKISMSGTFASSQDRVTRTSLPFHLKQLEDQTNYKGKNGFQALDNWPCETWPLGKQKQMSPIYCLEEFPGCSKEHGWPKQRSVVSLSWGDRRQGIGRPRKLESVEKNTKERGSCTERMQRVPSNLDSYNVTGLVLWEETAPGQAKTH